MADQTSLEIVQKALARAGVKTILIGGFAVIYYGYQRATQDLDLMICLDDLANATMALENEGFVMAIASDVCAKFKKKDLDLKAVDLVLVEKTTFQNVWKGGHSIPMAGTDFMVPSLEGLLAMKLHAIKQDPIKRLLKDIADIARLLDANGLDPRDNAFKQLCLRFGTQDIYDKILVFFPT